MAKDKPAPEAKEIDINSLDADLVAAQKLEETKNTVWGKIAIIFAFAMSLYHIVKIFWGSWSFIPSSLKGVIPERGIHVALAFTILFLTMPLYEHLFKDRFADNKAVRAITRIIDVICIIALWAAIYMCSYEYEHLSANLGMPGKWAAVAGCILFILVLEGARRCLGYIMPILALLFFAYARWGHLIQGRLGHAKYSFKQLFQYMAIDLDGVFGTTISVSAGVIFMFVMFGAFLEASGCSTFINDLALSLTGKLRSGPALSAVVASALMGCINGSAVANVVGTGTFTIPLMKSRGYKSDFAGGVEAVASTGGQILPPVMGSGAFLMVAFTLEKYTTIVKAAVIPAVLYFLGAGIAVYAQGEVGDVELLPKDQIPKTRKVLQDGWMYLVIIAVLVWALLIAQYTPVLAALIGTASVPVVMLVDRKKRFTFKDIPKSLVKSSFNALSIVAGCACAGIVVAMVARTGLGVKFGDAMINAAGGRLFLSLLFTAIACIILGMGLPTTSAYVIGASILAPALIGLKLTPLTAHLFVFYFACLSAITPPVALAAYAGAGIAKSNPMTTAVQACKIGFAGFIVPFVFCYNSALNLNGTLGQILMVCGTALVGCFGMSCGMQGWYFSGQRKISWLMRIIIIGAGLCMMIPSDLLSIVGLVILVLAAIFEKSRNAKKVSAAV
ncbi:MAG: TRAP transporter fused permease subunit [Lachnospiraceae bacterium]|nr:TRAP transporter fused permease subunit [Lachnospiraceae bacterium]